MGATCWSYRNNTTDNTLRTTHAPAEWAEMANNKNDTRESTWMCASKWYNTHNEILAHRTIAGIAGIAYLAAAKS
jgi:hypothetical protein